MTEEPYHNREIREMFSDVKTILDRIEAQTTKTNGRVTNLEWWRQWMAGGMAAFALLLVPTFMWMLSQIINLKDTIHEAVSQALEPYSKP